MRSFLALCPLILFLSIPAVGSTPKKQDVYKTYLLSVLRISSVGTKFNGEKEPSYGSGFAVGTNGLVVTSNHIFPKDLDLYKTIEMKAYFTTETGIDAVPFKILARNQKSDLALLQLESPLPGPCCAPVALGTEKAVGPGSDVYFIGYPGGLSNVAITPGLLSSLHGPTGWWQLSSNMNEGNSGSPVFDERGLCIGIAAAGLNQVEIQGKTVEIVGVNFIIPIEQAMKQIWPDAKFHDLYPDGAVIKTAAAGDVLRKAVPQFSESTPAFGKLVDQTFKSIILSAPTPAFDIKFGIPFSKSGMVSSSQNLNDFARSANEAVRRELIRNPAEALVPTEARQSVVADPGYRISGISISNGVEGNKPAPGLKISEDGNSASFQVGSDLIGSKILNRNVVVIEQVAR